MRPANKLGKLWRLRWPDRLLLLEAIFWLALARLALLVVPFRRIAPLLGTLQHESAAAVPDKTAHSANRIGWSVRTMARRTPWESACLTQAVSAKAMLHRRHIHSTLYLGLAKNNSQAMKAHAWLRCGAAILTGEAGHEQFTVLSSFAEETAVPQPKNPATAAASPKAEDLLLAVLNPVPQPKITNQLGQLGSEEWEALVKIANQQHVLTLLYACLQRLNVETAVPRPILDQMRQKQQQITMQNLAIYRELRLISEQMQAEEVPMIVLKGAYLATAVYPHISQRTVGDLDLLVPEEKVLQAADVMHRLGWQETQPFTLDALRQHHHHLPTFVKKGVNFPVEIHWNIALPLDNNRIKPDDLWPQPMTISLAGTDSLAFPPHLQLLHLALHTAYNHQFAFDLRSLCDIALLIEQQAAALDWPQFIDTAKLWQWERGIYLTLKLVQEFWQTAVPPYVLVQLKPAKMPANLTQLAKEQILWGLSNNRSISTNFSQLKGNKSLPDKVRFVFRFVFPTRSFLSSRYGVNPNSARIGLYYLINFRDLMKRNTRRTWRLLRGQQTVNEAVDRRNQLSEWLAENE
ncbi:MAG: lasso peptide biosynthesis B2 protein [Ardenticatenaceae bacterium]|nr:lasso peptide biosynthesis B2 protein [Anaerolineales bacterium]MCB8981231.1 lasso peptide biosynthesis B2 protein [Ardenticatenaceae bacterium]